MFLYLRYHKNGLKSIEEKTIIIKRDEKLLCPKLYGQYKKDLYGRI